MNMRIIDGHIHVDDVHAADVAHAALGEGASQWGVLSLSQYLDDPLQNLSALYAKALEPARCFAFCGLNHPHAGESEPDYLSQLRLWMDAGADGLKLIETKPSCAKSTGVRLDDMRFDAMFAWCEARQIPILWHNGDPADFWDPARNTQELVQQGWAYGDGTFLPLTELYAMTERVLERHPLLKVTFAHFYFVSDDPEHALRMMERYPNIRFDLTPGTEMYGGFTLRRDFFRPFFLRYADRLQYGTDTDVNGPDSGAVSSEIRDKIVRFLTSGDTFDFHGFSVRGYALPEETAEQILAGTFRSFAGCVPAPLRRDAMQAACAETRHLLAGRNDPRLGTAVTLERRLLAVIR